MTTIIRFKDHIISDSRFLTIVGDQVGLINGPMKFFKHPTNKAVIAMGGGIANKGLFDTLTSDIDQAIIDLSRYPECVPKFPNAIKMHIEEKKEDASRIDQTPSLLIATKDWTCTVMFFQDSPEKPLVSVYPAKLPTMIGSGAETLLPLIQTIKDKDSLIEAMRLCIMADTHSGNTIHICDLSDMEQL